MERQATTNKMVFVKNTTDKGLVFRLYKILHHTNKENTNDTI